MKIKNYDPPMNFIRLANNGNKTINKNYNDKYSQRFDNLKLLFNKIINIKYLEDQNK